VSTIPGLWITPPDVTDGEILRRFAENHLHSTQTLLFSAFRSLILSQNSSGEATVGPVDNYIAGYRSALGTASWVGRKSKSNGVG
jgi:hypothetical protein